MIIVGVNGGGTKTESICCNGDGAIIGKGASGPSNYNNLGVEKVVKNIHAAVMQAANADPDFICIALAGMNTKRDFEKLQSALSKVYKNLLLEHDAFAELYGVRRGKPGVIVIAGTGSIALGYDGNRVYRRCDNGYFLGDSGSGYYIGKEGLKITARMLLEDMEPTDLASDILRHLGLNSADDLMEWTYSEKNTVASVAAIGNIVCNSAEKGDKNAKAIVDLASSSVGNAACELALKLHVDTVYIKGGIAKSSLYYSNFSQIMAAKGIATKHLKDSQAEGALLIAADRAGVKVRLP
ncbi:MAG: ATPase [Candidatus Micrarchaeota archaeon]|nr:ATPase [Candidatus Micrarchaeota archaeon]MDE1834217.1 ATPase [Candidatus Micrarchaeota archaeon]MDE1859745.1 ATPase [Candidatus Micrarchaeota archaeon]